MKGCLKVYNNEYKGKVINMAKQQKRNKSQNNNVPKREEVYEVSKSTISIVKWVTGGCFTALIAILGVVGWMGKELYDLNALAMQNQLTLNSIDGRLGQVERGVYGDGGKDLGLFTRFELLLSEFKPSISLAEDMYYYVGEASFEKNETEYKTTSLEENIYIGIDSDGKKCYTRDLIGETTLLTYKEEGKDVFFLGKINENYNWDGYCITNSYYADGTLSSICESNFGNGERLDYKSIYLSEEGKWIYSNRVHSNGQNKGISITYVLEASKTKNFTVDNVRTSDIIFTDDFLEKSNARKIQYYSGNTVDGLYNDTTGNAYHVKYDEDGTVLTLYVGNFAGGTYNDSTGNAWDIAYSEECDIYVYNTGKFINGGAVNKSTYGISMEEIEKIIAPYAFECGLKWKDCFEEVESEMPLNN